MGTATNTAPLQESCPDNRPGALPRDRTPARSLPPVHDYHPPDDCNLALP